MSSEILAKEFKSQKKELVHSFVHDLEGFFWVLVWLCLSRDGPACRWCELLPDNQDPQQKLLCIAFTDLFEENDKVLALTKQWMFIERPYFYNDVLGNISVYCTPLQGLLHQFYNALHDTHKHHSSEGLYVKVLNAFTTAEMKVA